MPGVRNGGLRLRSGTAWGRDGTWAWDPGRAWGRDVAPEVRETRLCSGWGGGAVAWGHLDSEWGSRLGSRRSGPAVSGPHPRVPGPPAGGGGGGSDPQRCLSF